MNNLNINFSQIYNDILKTIIQVFDANKLNIGKDMKNNCTFQLFGFDIILDSKLKPYILEINAKPSMTPYNNKDLIYKSKIIEDIFNILKIIKISDKNLFDKIYSF